MEENEIRLESTAEENLPYELALSLEGEKPFFFFFFTRVWRLEFSKLHARLSRREDREFVGTCHLKG